MTAEAMFVEPLKLTEKLSRNTKGIMVSLAILMSSATLAVIGDIIDEWITMTIGYVVAGICSVSILIFFIQFVKGTNGFERINKELSKYTNRISISLFYAFFLAIAGFASTHGDYREWTPSFFLARFFGITSIICYILLFYSVNGLFKELTSLKLYQSKKRSRNYLIIILIVMLIETILDTVLRISIWAYYEKNIFNAYDEFTRKIGKPLTWSMLGFLLIADAFLCFELVKLSNRWLEINKKIDEKYLRLPPQNFDELFERKSFMMNSNLALAIALSFIVVISYLLLLAFGDIIYTYTSASVTYLRIHTDFIIQIAYTVGPFIVIAVIFTLNYLIRTILNYHKISQLSKKTANYGIVLSVMMIVSPFIIITGFFFNTTFNLRNSETFLVSRILMILGLILFSTSTLFISKIIHNLRDEKKKITKRKEFILPASNIFTVFLLVTDTIVRVILWNVNYDGSRSARVQFTQDMLWISATFAALFGLALIGSIYGFVVTKKEISGFLPKFGKIPVKIKKEKITVLPTVSIKPELKEVIPEEAVLKEEIVYKPNFCFNCGEKLEERFRFCPTCGEQEEIKETVPKSNFCAKCGEKINKSFRFCPTCGVQFE